MSKDSDPVTVTLPREEWRQVLLWLPESVSGWAGIKRQLDPVPAPDPATFKVKVPNPRRTKPWPELKSSQDADNAGA